MNDTPNPYAPPNRIAEWVPSAEPRVIGRGGILLAGASIGTLSFLAAMALIPRDVPSVTQHDLRLANNLGFIYPPLLGLWAAWVRRSIPWAFFGVLSGLAVGYAYYALCGTNFLAVMIGFPCLLGGATSVLLGTRHDSWIDGIPQRLGRGLVAGLALGFTYAVLLQVFGAFTYPGGPFSVATYSTMMWRGGTMAMIVASSVYFLLFHWSAGLRTEKSDEPSVATEAAS